MQQDLARLQTANAEGAQRTTNRILALEKQAKSGTPAKGSILMKSSDHELHGFGNPFHIGSSVLPKPAAILPLEAHTPNDMVYQAAVTKLQKYWSWMVGSRCCTSFLSHR